MKGSPCCAGLMWSCLHTYRTKTNLTQHIIQLGGGVGGGHQPSMGGHQPSMGGSSAKYGGVINQLWGGHQLTIGGAISQVLGGPSAKYGGVINQLWGGPSTNYGGGGGIFPPVCTGSQNPQNYFSNTYVLPSVNRTAGPKSILKLVIWLMY